MVLITTSAIALQKALQGDTNDNSLLFSSYYNQWIISYYHYQIIPEEIMVLITTSAIALQKALQGDTHYQYQKTIVLKEDCFFVSAK